MNKYKAFIQAFDLRVFVKNHMTTERVGNELHTLCIYHNDHRPSLSVGKEVFFCFSCGAAGDSLKFLSDYMKRRPSDIIEDHSLSGPLLLSRGCAERKRTVRFPSEKVVELGQRTLWRSPEKLMYLRNRGLKLDTIYRYELGYWAYPTSKYPKPRYTIPIRNVDGDLVTIRYRRDDNIDSSEEKYLMYPGSAAYLYNLRDIDKGDSVVLAGSQLDALLLSQSGIPCVGTASENVFHQEWADFFGDKKVYILYDNDDAGRAGAKKVNQMIHNSVVLSWPPGLPDKYDIGDSYKKWGDLGEILDILSSTR